MKDFKGTKVRDLSEDGKVKIVESVDVAGKLSPSDDDEWVPVAYAERTELV